MKWKRWMRAKIVYHKHSTRNVYLFTYLTCFHSLIFYISLDQTSVVYFFRRISLSFISHRHLTSSSHLVVISSRCHLTSLSSHLVVILHHFRKMNSSNFVSVNVSGKKTTGSRISVKMVQVKAALVKTASVKRASVKRDKKVSVKKASNRIIIEVRKIAEKRIILSAEDEKITNFWWFFTNLNKTKRSKKFDAIKLQLSIWYQKLRSFAWYRN